MSRPRIGGRMAEPDWLKGEARWAFRQLVKLLGDDGMRILSKSDRHALILPCDDYREWRGARRHVEEHGQVYEAVNKRAETTLHANPSVGIAAEAWRQVRQMLLEFGLTPAARAKVKGEETGEADPLDEMLETAGRKRTETKSSN